MAIREFNETSFSSRLNQLLSPSDPIRSEEDLQGREKSLTEIRRSLAVKGRHIFIHGDRGVGKTSLAQTSAIQFHPSINEPVRVACGTGETFETVIATVAKRVYAEFKGNKLKVSGSVKLPFVSASLKTTIDSGEQPIVETLNDAVDALKYVSACHGQIPVVVIDEFDRLVSKEDQAKFAELIKQISDQEIAIKLIFCGIGSSMHDLLGQHYSAGRAITPIELERLDDGSLWKIVETSAAGLGLQIDRETVLRIAILSDGFPYFTHLVCEQTYWSAFDDSNDVSRVSLKHFGDGIERAVEHALSLLKESYDNATKKYRDDYEEVLWSLVDRPTLSRQSSEIYESSYLPMMESRSNRTALDKKKFDNRLNTLKTKRHGCIIVGRGAGWYEFSENMLRGYVKLIARKQGVELGIDHHNAHALNSRDRI